MLNLIKNYWNNSQWVWQHANTKAALINSISEGLKDISNSLTSIEHNLNTSPVIIDAEFIKNFTVIIISSNESITSLDVEYFNTREEAEAYKLIGVDCEVELIVHDGYLSYEEAFDEIYD